MKKGKYFPDLSINKKLILFFSILFIFLIICCFVGLIDFLNNIIGNKLTIILLFFIFSVVLFIFIKIIFIRPLIIMKEFIKKSSGKEGDLTARLALKRSDEFGMFVRNFNIFISKIHNIIFSLKNIIKLSYNMGQTLASNTEETAASIREITSSVSSMNERENLLKKHAVSTQNFIDEIRDSIKKIIKLSETQTAAVLQASGIIEESITAIRNLNNISESKIDFINSLKEMANEGERNMSDTLNSIRDIANSADTIRGFIRVINDVAQQTNLLAMNAAIEAAHAGKFGAGFSVVADEIRGLSETTAENAKKISSNLNNIISAINHSESLTEKTDRSINVLTKGIQEVSDAMSQMISSLSEISTGTTEILSALKSLRDVSDNLQNESTTIDDKSGKIDNYMKDIVMLTRQSTQSMSEATLSINEIQTATEYISKIGNENYSNIRYIEDEISRFKIIDTSMLTSSDGQPLIQWNNKIQEVPPRPDNPDKYPEEDKRRWYDMEYAGWHEKKENIPLTPADGANGKYICFLLPGEHPYYDCYQRGIKKIADLFNIRTNIFVGDFNNPLIQKKQVDQAIKERPDLIILVPNDSKLSVNYFKKINMANIPVIAATQKPNNEAFRYIIGYTGTDEWSSYRLLARKFAEFMNNDGGYCIIQHAPGGGPYYARTFAVITELNQIAKNMKCLDKKYTEFNKKKTKQVVISWLNEFRGNLKGIITADHGEGILGIYEALDEKNITNMIIASQGHNKITLDLVKKNKLHAITMQSAETDGALPIEMAIDYFNGVETSPLKYMPVQIITGEVVDKFYPPQW